MNIIAAITWDVSPEIFEIGPLIIRWYGLLYALTFVFGLLLMQKVFKSEKIPVEWADNALLYIMLGVIVGARLGHCLFYAPKYYLSNPIEILQIWKGGLASHGGAAGIILALWYFSVKTTKMPLVWLLDRIVPMVGLGGLLIRTGNLMNSEIIGQSTELPWGVLFVRAKSFYPLIARHPAQMYEALWYFLLFLIMMTLYYKTNIRNQLGRLFGFFATFAFAGRFFIEFIKENQEFFEQGLFLNMGQLLSIPLIVVGIYFLVRKPVIIEPFEKERKKRLMKQKT